MLELWSTMAIDDYPVHAKYVGPGESDLSVLLDVKWYIEHVRESQYLLQIVKCKNTDCCVRPRSVLFRLLNNRFLPPPLKVKQTADDLIVDDELGQFLSLPLRLALHLDCSAKEFVQMPYDYFCPSVKPKLSSRTCKKCGLYHASVKTLDRHSKEIHTIVKMQTETRVRPVRVAARRANELMCKLDGDEEVEWLEEEDDDIPEEICSSQQTLNIEHQTSNVIDDLVMD